jgi:hypothetical protein
MKLKYFLIILILVSFMFTTGCINENKNPVSISQSETVSTYVATTPTFTTTALPTATATLTTTASPTATSNKLPNDGKYKLCNEKYPGTAYNISTDKCERDNEKYCAIYHPGSIPDPSTNTCRYPTPKPTTYGGFVIMTSSPSSIKISSDTSGSSLELRTIIRPYSPKVKVQLTRDTTSNGSQVIFARDFHLERGSTLQNGGTEMQLTSWFTIYPWMQGKWNIVATDPNGWSGILKDGLEINL